MAAFNIGEAIQFFEEMGVYEYFLPFLLVFAIVFAILEKTQVFGTVKLAHDHEVPRSSINAIVAVVMGLLLIAQQNIVEILNAFLPNVAMIIVIILMFLLVASMISGHGAGDQMGGFMKVILWIAGIVGVIALVVSLAPTFNWRLSTYEIERLVSIGIFVLLILGMILLVTWGSITRQRPRSRRQPAATPAEPPATT